MFVSIGIPESLFVDTHSRGRLCHIKKKVRTFGKPSKGGYAAGLAVIAAFAFAGCGHVSMMRTPRAHHVVIIGCDGMSPDGIRNAETPHMDELMRTGAYTFHARGVMPTSSSPNWASMIMGAGPEQHGVTSNDWRPDRHDLDATGLGSGGIFPTIFGVLREERPSSVIGCFYDWGGYGRLFERDAVDKIVDGDGPVDTTEQAVAFIKEEKPRFTFIHLDHVDHVGHDIGHGTPEYYEAVEEADRLIGMVVRGLREAGIYERTLLIFTSDHGGRGKGHGGATMAEIEIPWIVAGPGVRRGREIAGPVNTYDTAATAAYVLGVTPPDVWIARPVYEAFR